MSKLKITVKSAQTLDGKITTQTGDAKWITSKATRDWARKQRATFDAILVGIETVLADNPSLHATPRNYAIKKVVLDSRLRIPVRARLFQKTKKEDCILVTTKKASKRKIVQWEEKGVVVLISPLKDNRIDLKWLGRQLPKLGIQKLLIEGGPTVIGSALKEGIVDSIHVYIAPKIIGDARARNSIEGLNITNLSKALRFKNLTLKKLNKDLLVQADVHRTR